MLLLKKINSQKEYDTICAATPNAKLWGIGKNGNLCQVALPENKKILGFTVSSAPWDNIYYFPALNTDQFILKLEQSVPDGKNSCLANIKVQIAGWNYMANMSQIIAWANENNGELTLDVLENKLAETKNRFFDYLQDKLNHPQTGIVQSADMGDQIKEIARQNDWLSRFFPWFKVEKIFVNTTIQRSPEEEALIAKMNEQAERRRALDQQLEQARTESEYKVMMEELQSNEAEQLFAFQLREKERIQALYQKDCELQLAEETGLLTKQKAVEELQLEMEENRHKAKEAELEHLRRMQELKNKTEAEAAEHEKQMEKLQLAAEVEEKEHALRLIQLQLSQDKTAQEKEELKKKGELALQEFELASAKIRKEMSDLECQKELNRIKAEFEHASLLSKKAEMESEQSYWKKQAELWNQVLNSPDSMFLIDRVGMEFKQNDPMKYAKPVVMAKFQAQQQKTEKRIMLNCNAVQKQTRGLSCKKQNVMSYGTEMVFSLNIPMDGYLTLLCFEADGGVQLLTPNFANVNPWITKGTYTVPNAECSLIPTDCISQTARVGGQEHIAAIVSNKPLFDDIDFRNQDDFVSLSNEDYRKFIDKLYDETLDWSVGYTHYVVVESATAETNKYELNSRGIL